MSLVDLLPGQHADTVRDHWWWRPGWQIGRRFYAFHITFDGNSDLQQLVGAYRDALADIPTVTLIPDRWIHLTMQGIGFADEVPTVDVQRIAQRASKELLRIPPFDVSFGDIVVADEAIALPAEPAEPVRDLRNATRRAIAAVLGEDQVAEDPQRFRPHVSVAYITADGPANTYIDAVKAAQPDAVRVRIEHVDLIEMHRDNRMYEWTTVAALPLA
jgi:2'-5' RNA ligase